jgi:hypothetical protein
MIASPIAAAGRARIETGMTTEELIDKVKSLSAEKQRTVVQFIDFLERCHIPASSPILQAAEQFMAEHPELLRRLAE